MAAGGSELAGGRMDRAPLRERDSVMPENPILQVPASDVLAAIFDGCDGLIEFRALPSKDRTFVAVADMSAAAAQFCQSRCHEDLYFGVATRRSDRDGSLANCQHLGALFVDIDYENISEKDARVRLDRCPCSPSFIVQSGGGLHVYWLLREPLDLTTEADAARAVLRRLAGYLGGDLQAAEPARILRVPGTLNHKYQPARRVTVADSV